MSKLYWVRWSGTIGDESGAFDSTDPSVRAFLRALSLEFSRSDVLNQYAIVCPGDGTVSMSSVFSAANSGEAVNKAKDAFEAAIDRAGGSGTLPDGNDPSWQVREIVRLFEAQVRELARAA